MERVSARCFPRCQFILVRLSGGGSAGQRFPSAGLWIAGYSMTHIRRAPVVTRDFSALQWKPMVHKAPFEM